MSEQNKRLERRLVEEVWNAGNFASLEELVAVDYLGHSTAPNDETVGREGYRQFYTGLRQAFPDLHFTIEDQVAEGDKVVTRWTARGTHQGEFRGIAPTGRYGSITGITIDRIADGKVIECWTQSDDLGMLQQMGVLSLTER